MRKTFLWSRSLVLLVLLPTVSALAYDVDPALRKTLSKSTKQALVDVTPAEVAAVVQQCRAQTETVIGAKPIPQSTGDQQILRGIWQRNLEFVGRNLRDENLQSFLRADAADQFSRLYGHPSRWELTGEGFKEIPAETPALALEATAESPPPAPAPTTSTKANAGSSASRTAATPAAMERIALRTVTRYGLSGVYVENETYLLLKDGSILRNFYDSPYRIDVAASKRATPKNWGRWRRHGQALEVTWPGKKPALWKTWFSTRAAAPNQTIEGRFQSADGFGGGRTANFNTVAFTADGRFSWASLKGGNTGAWLPAYSEQRRAGRYELTGYSIHLRYNDGTVEEYAFCFYPKDDLHFVIGSSHFVPLS